MIFLYFPTSFIIHVVWRLEELSSLVAKKTELNWNSLHKDIALGRKGQSFSHISSLAQWLHEGPQVDSRQHSSPPELTSQPWKISKRIGLNLLFLPGVCEVQYDCMCVCNERMKVCVLNGDRAIQLSEGHLSFSTCAQLSHFHLQAWAALKSRVCPWIRMMDSDGFAQGHIN